LFGKEILLSNRKIKVAITGLSVSQHYIPNYVNAPESEVVIVHDIDAARAKQVAEKFGVPRWTTEYADVLASDADMVDVSTPNHLHAEQSIAAFEAGKHVLCQKPMGRTVAECKRMIEAARRTGRTLGVIMSMLDNPAVPDLRRAIAEGYLGKIASARFRIAHQEPLRRTDKSHWRSKRADVGGGSFIQLAIHQLNLALWLLDQNVESVIAYSDNLYCKLSIEGDDVTAAVARLDNGALMTMESGYSTTGNALEIYGTEGQILMVQKRLLVSMARGFKGQVLDYKKPDPDPNEWHQLTPPVDLTGQKGGAKTETNQNRQFVRALQEGKPAPTPGEIAMRDVAIVEAVYRSAELGRRVTLQEILDEE
jgi:predicted dehydrogenase